VSGSRQRKWDKNYKEFVDNFFMKNMTA